MTARVLITVDTEALPARAPHSHVERLIWGRYSNGQAGIEEMVRISEDVGAPFLFFLEVAGAVLDPAAYREVATFLRRSGQRVELHFHPEILGKAFWRDQGVHLEVLRQDLFSYAEASQTLSFAYGIFERICGRPARAYRSGSFRWNRATLRVMGELGIRFSFNSCRETAAKDNYRTYASPSSDTFIWSNGVIEIPCGEIEVGDQIVHLRFPRRLPKGLSFVDLLRQARDATSEEAVLIVLLHSWSFLDRDPVSGYFDYVSSKKMERFASILSRVRDEFDIVDFDQLAADVVPASLPRKDAFLAPGPDFEGRREKREVLNPGRINQEGNDGIV